MSKKQPVMSHDPLADLGLRSPPDVGQPGLTNRPVTVDIKAQVRCPGPAHKPDHRRGWRSPHYIDESSGEQRQTVRVDGLRCWK